MESEQKPSISVARTAIQVFDDFHDVDILEDLYTVLLHIFLPPSTFFVENHLIHDEKLLELLRGYFPPPLAVFIARHLKKVASVSRVARQAPGGWEFWTRVSTTSSPSFGYLHVDNDEFRRTRSGDLVSPTYGSVLYVGPSKGIGGGETAFLTDQGSAIEEKLFSNLPREVFSTPPFTLVPPTVGRFVLFTGDLPHAVMWTEAVRSLYRVTLLVNYWEDRISSVPEGVCSMTPAQYRGEDA